MIGNMNSVKGYGVGVKHDLNRLVIEAHSLKPGGGIDVSYLNFNRI